MCVLLADRVVDDEHFLCAEQLLADGDRAQRVVYSTACVAYNVRVAFYQTRQSPGLQSLSQPYHNNTAAVHDNSEQQVAVG